MQGIPIWEAITDHAAPISCGVFTLQSAAIVAKRMADAGENVVALTDGEITIKGDDLRALLDNPNALHMFNSKLYDSNAVHTLRG